MRSIFKSLAVAVCMLSPALAHEGEDHAAAPGTESSAGAISGPIEVSVVAQRNLGLTVAETELRPVETTLRVIGEIQADPSRSATVSSRISGRVSGVFAQEGEHVEKGRRLVEVESFQLGDPPPRGRYASPLTGVVTVLEDKRGLGQGATADGQHPWSATASVQLAECTSIPM